MAQQIFVYTDIDGDGIFDANEGTSTHTSIAAAIAAANSGQSVFIQNGTYAISGPLLINKSLKITGESEGGVVIDASASPAEGIWLTADNSSIANLTIKGPTSGGSNYGLKVGPDDGLAGSSTDNVRLSNITVEGSGKSEFDIHGVNGGVFTNLTARGLNTAGVGVAIADSANLTFTGLQTTDNGWGGIAVFDGDTLNLANSNIVIVNHTSTDEVAKIYSQGPGANASFDAVTYEGSQLWVVYTNGAAVGAESRADALAIAASDPNRVIEQPNGSYLVTAGMSIQAAIDLALEGETIVVEAGTFDVSTALNVTKSLTFQGANAGSTGTGARAAETILDGGTGAMVSVADGKTVSFDGFSFVGNHVMNEGGGVNVTVTNSVLDMDATGDNVFYFGYAGGYTFAFTNNKLTYSGLGSNNEVLSLFGGGTSTVTGNSFIGDNDNPTDRPVFVNVVGSAGVVSNNVFDNGDNGVAVNGDVGALQITGNTFQNFTRGDTSGNNFAAGVVFVIPDTVGPITITGNTFTDVDAGIRTSSFAPNGQPTLVGSTVAIDDNAFNGTERALFVHSNFAGSLTATDSTVDGIEYETIVADAGGTEAVTNGTDGNDTLVGTTAVEETISYDEAITVDELSYTGGGTWTVDSDENGFDTITHFDKVESADGTSILLVDKEGSYTTIQAAVDAAEDGDTILIAAGTYREQVLITGMTLSIVAYDGATLEMPDSAAITASGGYNAGITVIGGSVTIDNLDVNGRNQGGTFPTQTFAAVAFVDADGRLTNAAIAGFQASPLNGAQHGYGVLVRSIDGLAHDVEIDNNVISGFQKNGIDARGPGLSVNVHDNAITGAGATGVIAQNGIALVNGTTGTIDGNTIGDIAYVGTNPGAGTGILLFSAAGDVVVTNNDMDLSGTGSIGLALEGTSAGTITGNDFADAAVGIRQQGTFATAVTTADANAYTGVVTNFVFDPDNANTAGFAVTGTDGADLLDGAAGGDALGGGDGADLLIGRAGGDTLDGGDGIDTAVFGGNAADATVATTRVNGFATAFTGVGTAADGSDTLSGIERVQFADRTLDLAQDVQLFDASGDLVGTFDTIQAAVNAAGANATIVVAAGEYDENVTINRSDLTLISADGRDTTTIRGLQAGGEQAALVIADGVANVTVGGAAQGFTIIGINGPGNDEKAAFWFSGNNSGITVRGNDIAANGDGGMTSVYGSALSDILIDGNTFSGKTFTGDYVTAFGGGVTQFTPGNNIPRQLVAVGGGDNLTATSPAQDVTFSNNLVTGTAGAETLDSNGNPTGVFRGNQLVTIDAANSTVDNNDFTGTTYAGAYALRTRGAGTDVTNNDVTGDSAGFFIDNKGVPGTYTGNTLTGDSDGEIVQLTPGDDIANAGAGDDQIAGAAGNDAIDGGLGSDTARYTGAAGDADITGSDTDGFVTSFDTVTTAADGTDALTSIEKLAFTNGGTTTVLDLAQRVQLFDADGELIGTFNTIQAAVNAAPVNGTIRTAAGTYDENVVIQTAGLTLEGAADRTSVIRPGTSDAIDGNVVTVLADGVTIDGFTITGANTLLTGGLAVADGTISHAARLVSNYQDSRGGGQSIDSLTVNDNAFSYGQRFAVVNYTTIGGSSGGSLVADNDFTGLAGIANTGALRTAVLVGPGSHTDVKTNTMVDVGEGIQTNSLSTDPIDGSAIEITGNVISAQRGIFVNNHFGPGVETIVANNVVTQGASASTTASVGIRIWSFSNGAIADIHDNVVSGTAWGYRFANMPGETRVVGGTVTNTRVGVEVYDAGDYSTFQLLPGENVIVLEGVSITGSTTANVRVADSAARNVPLTIAFDATNPPTLGTAPSDVVLNGDTAKFDANGFAGDLKITGNGEANELAGGAGDDTLNGGAGIDTAQFEGSAAAATISGTQDAQGRFTSFSTVTTATGGTDTLVDIERVSFDDGATAVTLDSAQNVQLFNGAGAIVGTFDTIQAAIDAASDGFTIRAAAGVYDEDLNINKAVTILGAKLGSDGTAAGRDAANGVGETTILGDSKIRVPGDVTIDGVRFLNDSTTTGNNAAGNPTLQVTAAGSGGIKTVTNSIFWSTVAGGANGVDDRAFSTQVLSNTDVFFTDNLISGTNQSGFNQAAWGRGVWFDGGNGVDLTVSGSTLQYVRSGFNADLSGTATFTASDNLIDTATTAFSVGVDTAGLSLTNNDFNQVGTEFNLRTVPGFTFDMEVATDAATGTANGPNQAGTATIIGAATVVATGGAGNDTILGTSGADYIDDNAAGASFETDTTADTDTLSGRGGDDVLVAEFGDDLLIGGTGNDVLIGGGGDDTAQFANARAGLIVTATADADPTTAGDQAGWQVVTFSEGTDKLNDVEIVQAADGRILLVGNGGYLTLADAMADAVDGDTILVAAGNYGGNATIDKDVTILGANAGIAGTGVRGAESVLTGAISVTADGVSFDGVKFTGQGNALYGGGFFAAISVGGDNLSVTNSVFEGGPAGDPANQTSLAFSTSTVTGLAVGGNLLSGYDIGLYITAGSTGVVSSNTFQGDGVGSFTGMGNGVNTETTGVDITGNTFDALYSGSINTFPFDTTNVDFAAYIDPSNVFSNTVARPIQYFPVSGNATVVGTDANESYRLDEGGLTAGITVDARGGADALFGSNFDDSLEGGAGNDIIDGNGGDDLLFAGAGDDAIDGGANTAGGGDTLVLSGTYAQYTTSVSGGTYTITGPDGTDTVTGVEKVRIGGTDFDLADLPDDAPIGVDDSNQPADPVKEDTDNAATGNVLLNDTNSDSQFGDELVVTGAGVGSEGGATLSAPGSVLAGTYGTVTIATEGSYTYTLDNTLAATQALAAGANGLDTFTYRVADNAGQTDLAQLVITVAGTNDRPTVTGATPSTLSYTESATNPPAQTTENFAAQGGTLAVNDVDDNNTVTGVIVGTPTVTWNQAGSPPAALQQQLTTGETAGSPALTFGSVQPNGDGANLPYTYNPGSAAVNQLSDGQVVTVTYTVRVTDDSGTANATSTETQQITVTIVGQNEVVPGTTDDDDNLMGSAQADDIDGGAGDDSLSGAGGDDDINGGAGDDSILAGAGNDEVFGGDGDDSIDGGSENDIIYGGAGTDSINGGSGNDTIYVEQGDDSVNGGSGNDTLVLDGAWVDYTISRAGSTYVLERNGQEITASSVESFVFTGNTGNDGPFLAGQILNDGPDAKNDTATATGGTVSGLNVLTQGTPDSDADFPLGDFLTVTGVRTGIETGTAALTDVGGGSSVQIEGTYGTLTIAANGSYSYAVNTSDTDYLAIPAGQNRVDQFTYRASDAKGLSDLARLTVTVIGGNSPPTGSPQGNITGTEDVTLSLTNAALTQGYSDVNGDPLTAVNLTADRGTVTSLGNGNYTLSLPANQSGAVVLSYQVTDGNGGSANAQRTVTFTAVDDAPTAADGTATTAEDTAVQIDVASLIGEVDGNAYTVSATSADGIVSVAGTVITFTPAANSNGAKSITYTVTDSTGAMLADSGTIAVTVTPVNDAPVAVSDSLTTAEDTPLVISDPQVLLGNDTDADGDTLTIVEVITDANGNGTVTRDSNGVITFTPDADYNGPATFSYRISDGTTTSVATATVNVAVSAVNDAPTGSSTATLANGTEDQGTYFVSTADLLQGFGDVDSPNLAVVNLTAQGGSTALTVTPVANGYTVTLPADFNGSVALSYGVTDGEFTIPGSLSFTVDAVNDAPVAVADTLNATEDTVASFAPSLLLGNDTDADGDTLTVQDVQSVSGGTVALDSAGNIVFTPAANFNGPATFTYRVTDGTAISAAATVTVNVAAVNDAATITGTSTGSVTEEGPLTTSGDLDVSDVDSGEAVFRTPASLQGSYGTFTFNSTTGAWGYTLDNANPAVQALNTGQTLSDTLQVTSSDGTATATLTVTVNGLNEPQDGIYGTEASETITGTAAGENIFGLGGNDVLIGLGGADRLDGGNGSDTASYAGSAAAVTANLLLGGATGGDGQGDTFVSIENLLGSANNDSLTGNDADNVLDGSGGNDTLIGNGGNDRLVGGAGTDNMSGGQGNDVYIVDAAGDVVTEAANAGTDSVETSLAAYQLTANVENLTYTGAANFTGNGSAVNNVITGGSGNDRLDGKAGADTMIGGLGNDAYFVDNVSDVVVENGGEGADAVNTSLASYTLGTNLELLSFTSNANSTGIGNDLDNTLFGAAGSDTLYGGIGTDRLVGNDGNDVLFGGGGSDTLTGGAGDDRFVWTTASDFGPLSRPDGITDFNGNDVIDLRGFGLTFVGTAAFTAGAGGQVRYVAGPSSIDVMIDFDGDGTQDAGIRVVGQASLNGSDFLL